MAHKWLVGPCVLCSYGKTWAAGPGCGSHTQLTLQTLLTHFPYYMLLEDENMTCALHAVGW